MKILRRVNYYVHMFLAVSLYGIGLMISTVGIQFVRLAGIMIDDVSSEKKGGETT